MRKLNIIFLFAFFVRTAFGVTCPSGTITLGGESTFVAIDTSGHCPSGYAVYDSPSHLNAYFNGVLLQDEVTLCGTNEYMSDDTCTSLSRGRCDSGYFEVTTASTTVGGIDNNGHCWNGTALFNVPTGSYVISTGGILNSAPTLCGTNEYMNNGTCTANDNTKCPTGWINYVSGAGTTFVPTSADTCGTNYVRATDAIDCGERQDEDFCAAFCDAGESLTWGGQCVPLCGGGITKLHVGSYTFPVYAQKTTEHALGVQAPTAVCYVNLASGNTSGAVNLRSPDGTSYHTTK